MLNALLIGTGHYGAAHSRSLSEKSLRLFRLAILPDLKDRTDQVMELLLSSADQAMVKSIVEEVIVPESQVNHYCLHCGESGSVSVSDDIEGENESESNGSNGSNRGSNSNMNGCIRSKGDDHSYQHQRQRELCNKSNCPFLYPVGHQRCQHSCPQSSLSMQKAHSMTQENSSEGSMMPELPFVHSN